ncbi:10710_t:CDS:2, partial [Funneliformis mosseae]
KFSFKECKNTSIQQKWAPLLQKYRDIKIKFASTEDPSVTAPVTSDSIYGITENQDDERKANMKEFQDFINEQTKIISEISALVLLRFSKDR